MPDATAATASGQTPLGPLALGALEMQAPRCDADAPAPQRAFCEAASRAVRRVFEDDSDDGATLLSLLNALEVEPDIAALMGPWHSILSNALARARWLAALGKPLRLLRHAMADAYLDPQLGLYRGVDSQACRAAFADIAQQGSGWQDLVVTLEPLGTYPLSTFRRFCFEGRTLAEPPP